MNNTQNPDKSGKNQPQTTETMALNTYNVQTWNTTSDDFEFPEVSGDQSYFPAGSKRPERGICFSGGGTVSIALIAGFLNALEEIGLIPEIGYISGVSGGTWGTAAYIYNPENDPNRLLGKHFEDPAEIPAAELTKTIDGTLAHSVCHAPVVDKALEFEALHRNKLLGDLVPQREIYTMAIGALFLRPFDIDSPCFDVGSPDIALRRKFFTTTAEQAANIAARNSMDAKTFMTMNSDRPYYIMNTTLLAQPQTKGSLKNVYPFEFTPLYAGRISDSLTDVVRGNQKIGGSYVETYGFNSEAKSNLENAVVKAENTYRFELQQPVGTSGSALGKAAQSGKMHLLDTFFPHFNYWNPADPNLDNAGNLVTTGYDFGDGGIIENTGITPLLARQLKYIAVFVSEMSVYLTENGSGGTIDTAQFGWEQLVFGYNQIAVLFGGKVIDTAAMKELPKQVNPVVWVDDTVNRQVFDNSVQDSDANADFTPATMLDSVMYQLQQVDAGPTSVDLVLNVVDNELFGIKAYSAVNIKLTIVGASTAWKEELTGDVKTAMDNGDYNLADFPNVQVFHQNKDRVIQLNPAQANLLGNLAYWYIMQQKEDYRKFLTGNLT